MINYEYYRNVYYGEDIFNEREFARLKRKAENLLNLHTFNRVNNVKDEDALEKVRNTLCELIEGIYHGKEDKELYQIIRVNLIYTGLMYRVIWFMRTRIIMLRAEKNSGIKWLNEWKRSPQ